MRKIFRILLSLIFIAVLQIFYSWGDRSFEMSGNYISETAFALISGTEVSGTIDKISVNTEISVTSNYLATVSYVTLENQKITRDFRYSEDKIPLNTQVHVLYDPKNPLKAALKEDANYFKYTCYGALAFIGSFTILLFLIAFLIYWLRTPKPNTTG